MASPQTENGYTEIANELLEELAKIRISGEEMQVLLVIIRKTYGWKKKEDRISLGQIAFATGLIRQHVFRAIQKLCSKKMITVNKNDDSQINSYTIQKDHDKWQPLPKRTVTKDGYSNQKRLQSITKDGYGTVTKDGSHKRKKAIKTNTPPQKPAPDPRVKELTIYFHDSYFKLFQKEPVIIYAKDSALIKARLNIEDKDVIKSMMDTFLTSDDKFIAGLPKTIGTFCSGAVFEKLRGVKKRQSVTRQMGEEEKEAFLKEASCS